MTPAQIITLERIVSEKHWHSHDGIYIYDKTIKESLYDLLSPLNRNEIDLILLLLEDYLIISEYGRAARELKSKIIDNSTFDLVCITPVVDFRSKDVKSGHHLHYEISKSASKPTTKEFFYADSPTLNKTPQNSFIHVSIDDFIGTGEQFHTMIQHMKENGSAITITHIACIVIQEDALAFLTGLGYKVIYLHLRTKALDALAKKFPDLDVFRVYDSIERRADSPTNYSRGRGQSQATVTMKATPNNTLPVFWSYGRSKRWLPPFPRPMK